MIKDKFDLVNGIFESVGGVLIWFNVLKLYLDKMIRGMSWQVTGFFWTWGVFNVFYYPHLGQWLSFAGGLVICSANFIWIVLAWRYRKN